MSTKKSNVLSYAARFKTTPGLARFKTKDTEYADDPNEKFEVSYESDKGSVVSIGRITTVDEVIEKAQIDLNFWEIYRIKSNAYQTPMKLKKVDGKNRTETPHIEQLWQISIWVRRKTSKFIEEAMPAIFQRMSHHAPQYEPVQYANNSDDKHLLEISIYDIHFGKLAWAQETGNDYDLKIAQSLYEKSVEEFITKSRIYDVEKIILPVGQDFFHIDNHQNSTFNGTIVDTDSRYAKIFEAGFSSCVQAIDRLTTIAPIEILYVPGNHDRTTSWHLVKCLQAQYSKNNNVTVDATPTTRKYVSYGTNLIGYTHGDQESAKDLPMIMATERSEFASSKCREWHIGHWHKKKEMNFVGVDSQHSVLVRIMPSLCGTDAWHYARGYVGEVKRAEAHLWSKNYGHVCSLTSYAK